MLNEFIHSIYVHKAEKNEWGERTQTIERYRTKKKAEREQKQAENEKLLTEKYSEWKSFYYSSPEKLAFMIEELGKNNIPIRETETGFEAQDCFVQKIRNNEKQFVSPQKSNRENLRDLLDKIVMQADDFDDIWKRLQLLGYEFKQGKYLAVKSPSEPRFIRVKSLGEMYTEQALRNRIINRNAYENGVNEKLKSLAGMGEEKLLEHRIYATARQYILTFKQDVLPAQKVHPNQPFTWINDATLDRLSKLNKKLNEGVYLGSLRAELERTERAVSEKEKTVVTLKSELDFFNKVYKAATLVFGNGERNPTARKLLADNRVTAENYERITELIVKTEVEIAESEQSLQAYQNDLLDTVDTLTSFEQIVNMTYVDSLVLAERNRCTSEVVNGVKSADISLAESDRIDSLVERTVEAAGGEERRSFRRG